MFLQEITPCWCIAEKFEGLLRKKKVLKYMICEWDPEDECVIIEMVLNEVEMEIEPWKAITFLAFIMLHSNFSLNKYETILFDIFLKVILYFYHIKLKGRNTFCLKPLICSYLLLQSGTFPHADHWSKAGAHHFISSQAPAASCCSVAESTSRQPEITQCSVKIMSSSVI